MRRFRALVHATVLELLSEPVCLLMALSALVLGILAPAIHYHQFGEPSRMARDAGFSSLLLFGLVYVVYGTHVTFRRAMESGTMAVALAHSVSRTKFFSAKIVGALLAYGVFAITVSCNSMTVVTAAEIGGAIAAEKGDLAKLWGPSVVVALAAPILSLLVAAILNRFRRYRFVLTSQVLMFIFAIVGACYRFDLSLVLRLAPAFLLFACPPLLAMVVTAAWSVRVRPNLATALAVLVLLASLPAFGNYCLSDALSNGGVIPLSYLLMAFVALVPAWFAFFVLGLVFINGKEAT